MKKRTQVELSLLIPTFNDETTIEQLVKDTLKELKKTACTYEILVCNDCSTDATPVLLKKLTEKYDSITVLTHTENKGYGETIKDLYMKAKGAWLMSLPGDYQFEPSSIHLLLPYRKKADMIIGKRIDRHDTTKRKLQSFLYNGLLRLLFQIPTTDTNSIRLMKKTIIDTITFKTHSAFVDAELVILAVRNHFSVIEVPVSHRFRQTGESTGGKFFKTILPTIMEMIEYRVHL